MAIGTISSLGSVNPLSAYGVEGISAPTGPSFADQLKGALGELNALSERKGEMIDSMISGEVTEVHDVMIAAKESQLAFELLLEVRNKLLEGYQELMRMQV